MNFIFNQENLFDIAILNTYSMCDVFNQLETEGGRRLLKRMFNHSLGDDVEIRRRKLIVFYFQESQLRFPFRGELIQIAENYISSLKKDRFMVGKVFSTINDLFSCVFNDKTYGRSQPGLHAVIDMLKIFREFLDILKQISNEIVEIWKEEYIQAQLILSSPAFNWINSVKRNKVVPPYKLAEYKYILKQVVFHDLEVLFKLIFELDIYMAMAVTVKKNMTVKH